MGGMPLLFDKAGSFGETIRRSIPITTIRIELSNSETLRIVAMKEWIPFVMFTKQYRPTRFHLVVLSMIVLFGFISGCSRTHYRKKADQEAYTLVNTVANDPRWQLENYTLKAPKDSRFYDPYNPDCEPMPYDDPTAHRLMQRVDGKKGSKAWEKYGQTSYTENPYWRQYLSVDSEGAIVLDKETAVRLALKHSPAYQTAMENLYKSALTVSAQRYLFDTKFYGGNSLFYSANGTPTTTLEDRTDLSLRRNFATGADVMVGLANTLTWQFSGPDTFTTQSVMNFAFIQPLLKGGGRAVVLEDLTQSERDFLAEVRQMVYYQQGFYVSTVTGSGGVPGPGGGGSGGSSGGYYSLLSNQVQINNQIHNIASLEDTLNRTTQLFTAGRLEKKVDVIRTRIQLLDSQNSLLQQKGNYEGSIESYLQALGLPPDQKVRVQDPLLEQFELMSPSLRRLQEDVNLLLALLRDENQTIPENVRERLPVFSRRLSDELGIVEKDLIYLEKIVPERIANLQFLKDRPSVRSGEVSSDVCSVPDFQNRIHLLQTALPEAKKRIEMIVKLNEINSHYDLAQLQATIDSESFDEKVLEYLYRLDLMDLVPVLEMDIEERIEKPYRLKLDPLNQKRRLAQMELNRLEGFLPSLSDSQSDRLLVEKTYQESLQKISLLQAELQTLIGEIAVVESERDKEVQKRIQSWVSGDRSSFEQVKEQLEQERTSDNSLIRVPDPYRSWLNRISYRLSAELNDLLILQARIRLDSITLTPIDVSAEEAFTLASENRLDWMNRRAELVDAWRQIEIRSNALKSLLNLQVDGSIKAEGNNPVDFRGKNGTVSVGLKWDSPLDRLVERNAYRAALINYQKARRDYYSYVDGVKANLRTAARNIQVSQLGFEIQRESVFSAIVNVDSAMLNLENPNVNNANATIDVLDNLNSLLTAQNRFMTTWVGYLQQRMQFELAMGILKLDSNGMWIDTGPLRSSQQENALPNAPIPQETAPSPYPAPELPPLS